jgi:DNA-binding GntR family transcriptional regulator
MSGMAMGDRALGDGADSTLVGRITRVLASRIVTGRIAPGTPLRQDHVAAEFGASHVPVREAFRRLVAQGLALAEPRRGVRVALLDAASIREVTEMRAALEGLALAHALPRLDEGALAAAEAALAEGETSTDITAWEAANRRFHSVLLAPSDMPRLLAAIDDLGEASARFLFAAWRNLAWQPRSAREHRAILAAARAGKASAIPLLERHIRAAGEALIRSLKTTVSRRCSPGSRRIEPGRRSSTRSARSSAARTTSSGDTR